MKARIVRRNISKTRKPRPLAITTVISGIVTYRTHSPLTEARALRFAKMIQANPRFLDATVTRSRKIDHFHVCFMPNSIKAIQAMLNAEDNKDKVAADRDGRNFIYRELTAGRFQCIGITGTYETTLSGSGSCTCPHFVYRRNSAGGRCKHMIELNRRMEAGLIEAPAIVAVPVSSGYGSPSWKTRASADF